MLANEDPVAYRMALFELYIEPLLCNIYLDKKGGAAYPTLQKLSELLIKIVKAEIGKVQ